MNQAKIMWETYVQKSMFSSEINAVKEKSRNNLMNQLGLQLDKNGLLRCHGRLISESLPESTFFPKLLPKNHVFTSLVINSFHKNLMHAGVSYTLWAIRREFYITQGRSSVRKVLLSCRRCRWYHAGPYRMPVIPPYPRSRIEDSPLFIYTGLDYLGPLYVKANGEFVTHKVWFCLFTYLLSYQSCPLRSRSRHVCRTVPLVPKKICRQTWQAKLVKSTVDEAWQLSTTSPDT